MTNPPKTVSDTIASTPPKIPADSNTKPIGEPEAAADALPCEPDPVKTPDLLKT